ncbi:hypothetical protein K435DRAFT_871193 [Dendrothele bispora CBS 962.96]|uniref:Uncharacterized protein n=1 Tax=Dendrothele bispora (strain CBS 962.96) TaxID=1314807 RepID=A0A4S8L599_DENBC|nr:hypothetical protein K435DRAFT_871193 [Dendrothele bispora CBS 962.96]
MKFTSAFLIALLNAPGLFAVGVSPSDGNSSLAKRDCWFGKPVGCTNGFCWKTCGNKGDGSWCWTASNKGTCTGCGEWFTCSKDSDCNANMPCGQDDPTTPQKCDDCGCSC